MKIPDEVDETVAAIVKAQDYGDAQKYARLLRSQGESAAREMQFAVYIYVDCMSRIAELLEKIKP